MMLRSVQIAFIFSTARAGMMKTVPDMAQYVPFATALSYCVGPQSDRSSRSIDGEFVLTDPFLPMLFGYGSIPDNYLSMCDLTQTFPAAYTTGKVCGFGPLMWAVCGAKSRSFSFLKSFQANGCIAIINLAPSVPEYNAQQPFVLGGEPDMIADSVIPMWTNGPNPGPFFLTAFGVGSNPNKTLMVQLRGDDPMPFTDIVTTTGNRVLFGIYCGARALLFLFVVFALFKLCKTDKRKSWSLLVLLTDGLMANFAAIFRHALDPIYYNGLSFTVFMAPLPFWEMIPAAVGTLAFATIWLKMVFTGIPRLSVLLKMLDAFCAVVSLGFMGFLCFYTYLSINYIEFYSINEILESFSLTNHFQDKTALAVLIAYASFCGMFAIGSLAFVYRVFAAASKSENLAMLAVAKRLFKFIAVEIVLIAPILVGVQNYRNFFASRSTNPDGEKLFFYHGYAIATLLMSAVKTYSIYLTSSS